MLFVPFASVRIGSIQVGSEVVVCSHEDGMSSSALDGNGNCPCLHSGKESYRVAFEAGRAGEGAKGKTDEFG